MTLPLYDRAVILGQISIDTNPNFGFVSFGQTFQLCYNIYGIVITDAPLLSLILGASIQHQEILEGSDVYFECNIQVSPFTSSVPIVAITISQIR